MKIKLELSEYYQNLYSKLYSLNKQEKEITDILQNDINKDFYKDYINSFVTKYDFQLSSATNIYDIYVVKLGDIKYTLGITTYDIWCSDDNGYIGKEFLMNYYHIKEMLEDFEKIIIKAKNEN
jgi:hypothetical protein